MTGTKYIGMDVHKESISIAVRNNAGKLVMECVIETKANVILDFIHGLRGELQVTFEEGTWATWLYDLLKPHARKLVVCDPRKNSRQGNKNDRIDARERADRLYMDKLSSVYHGGAGVRTLKELAGRYLTISKDLGRVAPASKSIRRVIVRSGSRKSPRWEFFAGQHFSGNPGGLNGSTQHLGRTRLALETKAKSLARVRSAGTLPWLGLIDSSRTVGFSIGKYCRTN
jgi:Transposase